MELWPNKTGSDSRRSYLYGNYIDEPIMMYANCLDAIDDDPNKPFERKYYYIQDGLYNVHALISAKNWLIEEETSYDVYGKAVTYLSGDFDRDGSITYSDLTVFNNSSGLSECDPNFDWRCDVDNSSLVDSTDSNALVRNFGKGHASNQQSLFTNPYYYTGRRIDVLDAGNLKLQYNRNRYYSCSMGRWLTHDPLGINPSGEINNPFSILSQYQDGMSLYEYVKSNSTINLDPHGITFRLLREINLNKFFIWGTRGHVIEDWEKVEFRCVSPSGRSGPRCKQKINLTLSLKLELLRSKSRKWKLRSISFDRKWGVPRSHAREREATLWHELDHWRTIMTFWNQAKSKLSPFDGKIHSTAAKCSKTSKCVAWEFLMVRAMAQVHAHSFDSSPWDQGDMYSSHPFTTTLDVSCCNF